MAGQDTKKGREWYERAAKVEADAEISAGGSGRQQLIRQGPKRISPPE